MIGDDKLLEFEGAWTGRERLEATAWTPAGTATGTFRIAGSAGVLTIDYVETRGGTVALSGHGVVTETGWWWFDSYGFEPREPGTARWEGDTLHLDRSSTRGRAVMRLRRQDSDLICEMLTASPLDGEFALMLAGRYTRAVHDLL